MTQQWIVSVRYQSDIEDRRAECHAFGNQWLWDQKGKWRWV